MEDWWNNGSDHSSREPLNEYNSSMSPNNSSWNESWAEEPPPKLTTNAAVKASVLTVMAVASVIGNAATLSSIAISKKCTNSSLYTLLFQLAISDLLVSIWCLSGEAAWTYTVEWMGGQWLCKTFKFSQVFSLYLSTFVMVLIGLDRLRAVRHPIRRALSSDRSCMKPIIAAWILSGLLASPQFVIFRVLKGPFREPFYQCVTYGFYTEEWQEQLYTILSLLTMFVIPLVVLICTYVCIFWTIAKKERAFRPQQPQQADQWQQTENPFIRRQTNLSRRRNIFRRAKVKSLRISFIIVAAFFVCWAPYYFMMITFIFLNPNDKLGEDLQSAIFFFGMSNSLVNPLIYGAFHLWRPNRKSPGSFSTVHTNLESWHGGSRRAEILHTVELPVATPPSGRTGICGIHFCRGGNVPHSITSCSGSAAGGHHLNHKRCSLHNHGRQNRSSVSTGL